MNITKYLLVFAIGLSALLSCQRGNKITNSKTLDNASSSDTPNSSSIKKIPPEQTIVPVNEISPALIPKRAYLATGYWTPIGAMQPLDSTVFVEYQGKAIKFREDLTFNIFQAGKIVDTGHWNFDSAKSILYLSCKNPYFNTTWQVIERGFVMIWIGQTNINRSGIQIKISNVNELPN